MLPEETTAAQLFLAPPAQSRTPAPPHSGKSVGAMARESVDASPIFATVVEDIVKLESLSQQWRALARNAIDPNIFYDPCILMAALRHLRPNHQGLVFLLLYAPDPDCPSGPPLLCAMFPFEQRTRLRGYPCRTLRLLRYKYGALCTPLVHRQFVRESVSALLNWLERSSMKFSLVEFGFITGEGRVAQELHQQLTERELCHLQSECTIRALFKPRANADLYVGQALRGKKRKEFRRLEHRLAETGVVEYRSLAAAAAALPWVKAFFELETRGWKGRMNTSLASEAPDAKFFEQAALEAHRHGQLMMLGLFHNDRPIAMKCNFLSGHGAYAFKIAFDEEYARYSPGVLLEIENLRLLHRTPQIAWMDSTADANHPMINRLWLDRRTVETLLVSPNRVSGDFIIAMVPLARWLKRYLAHSKEFRLGVENQKPKSSSK